MRTRTSHPVAGGAPPEPAKPGPGARTIYMPTTRTTALKLTTRRVQAKTVPFGGYMLRRSTPLFLIFLSAICLLSPAEETSLKNESEVGVLIASGNSQSQSFNVKQKTAYEFSGNTVKFSASLLKVSSRGVQSAKYWDLGLRYDRALTEALSLFAGQAITSDIFAGYQQRYHTDAGLKFQLVKQTDLTWNGEAGYRFTKENRILGGDTSNHYARIYSDAETKWNETVSSKVWFEFLPNFTTSSDWQFNSEVSTTAILSSLFSLKVAYLIKYDHLPALGVAETTDTYFTTNLVARF